MAILMNHFCVHNVCITCVHNVYAKAWMSDGNSHESLFGCDGAE